MNKIKRIIAINKFGKMYEWSADTLFWDELPKWLLNAIELELPNYQTNIEYND